MEEDKRNTLPSNWEAKKLKAEWILNDESQRQAAIEKVNGIPDTITKLCCMM